MSTIDHIAGETYHGRRGETTNAFRYSIDYVLLNPEAQGQHPALFARNRANVASVQDRDHGGAPGHGTGVAWVRQVLRDHGLSAANGQILLLTQPRLLGHVFNPVSFWLCHDADDVLRVVIAEVTNTFGDRHSYLCHHSDLRAITAQDRLQSTKIFHVSPFQPIEGSYTFRFDIRNDRIGIWIDYEQGEGGLLATLTGKRAVLSNKRILQAMLRRPLGARRVLALIHWQAFKLWWKGASFKQRPTPPDNEVSR